MIADRRPFHSARASSRLLAVLLACLLLPATAAAQPTETLQGTSLLGRALYSQPAQTDGAALAREALAADATDPELWLRYGLALSGSWHYREAIEAFSRGLQIDPFAALLYRFRGHRHISTRRFAEGAADLELASRLAPRNWDVWYHLGLAYFLLGDFERAATAYRRCHELTRDDGALVAVSDWYWMTLTRLGRQQDAAALLGPINAGMQVGDNVAYQRRLLLYKGELSPADVLRLEDASDLNLATLGFGLAHWYLVTGRESEGIALLERVVEGSYWPAFGFIAAEAELARRR